MPQTETELKLFDPEAVIKNLPIQDRMLILDLGCGSGYFTLPLARMIRPMGKVIAIDIWKPALDVLTLKAKLAGLFDVIETRQQDIESPKGLGLETGSVDLVLISNVLFQIENKKQVFEEIFRVLKNNGYLAVIEWQSEKLPQNQFFYPINKEELIKLLVSLGFKPDRDILNTATHYGLLFRKANL